MEKKRKKAKIKLFGVKLKDILQLATIIGGCVWAVHWLDEKFSRIDDRFARIETRLDKIEVELVDVRKEVTKTGNLLNQYLTWRFIYVNDPLRKNLVPLYDPATRTIEFVDRNTAKTGK